MKKKKNTLLWEVQGDPIKSPSYIFGSMHVRDQDAYRGIGFIQECILDADSFAAEYNLDLGDAAAFQAACLLPDGQQLQNLLSPPVFKKLSRVFERETGESIDFYQSLRPIMLLNILSTAQFNDDHPQALDAHLHDFAKSNGKELLGLESFEDQLRIMQDMPIRHQLKSLKECATNFSAFRKNLKKTAALYVEGDLQKILKKVKQSSGGLRKILLYDRNIKMTSSFINLASQQSLFASVGAGHLGGSKGILRLLKTNGLRVKPLSYA